MTDRDENEAENRMCPACGKERSDAADLDCPFCGEPASDETDRIAPKTFFVIKATPAPPDSKDEGSLDRVPPTRTREPSSGPSQGPDGEADGEERDLIHHGERAQGDEVPQTFFSHEASDAPVRVETTPPPSPLSPAFAEGDDTVRHTPSGKTETADPPDELKSVGRYKILRTIGRGGMGKVYLAKHPELGNEVALKVLHSAAHAGSEELERFRIEAQTAATLVHPHIVRTYDFGEVDGIHYLTQEYVVGTSLDGLIREDPPSPRRSMEILVDLARAVHYAHENGIIHRDLKPANVLLDPNGEPKLADFGLARRVGSSQLTRTGTVMGTPSYMAPEQAEGETDKIGACSDVYGLGAILYQMLTTKPPFTGLNPMEVIYKVIRLDPEPPQSLDRGISLEISAICLKCLEKRPADRYASALDLSEDCRRYLDGEPVLAKPVGFAKRTWRKLRRHRTLVLSLLGVALIGLASAAGVYYRYAIHPQRVAEEESLRKAHDRTLREADARIGLEEARTHLYAGRFEAAYASAGDVLTRFLRFAAHEDIPIAEARRVQAKALLADAQCALSQGRIADAVLTACRLLREFKSLAAKDRELPMADTHLLLAEVARLQDRNEDMRQELFHAYSATVGTSAENRLLARIGHLFYKAREVDLAHRIFERVARITTDPRAAFDARLGMAKCTASFMDFDRARAQFRALSREGSKGASEEIATWTAFLELLKGRTTLPINLYSMAARDLDGDGRPELIVRQGRTLRVGRLRDGVWEEAARFDPFAASGRPPHRLRAVEAFDLDGDGQREILLAGGSAGGRGSLFVMEWKGGRIALTAVDDLPTLVTPHPFCLTDYDGDGKKELLVAEQYSGRALRFYEYRDQEPRLRLLSRLPLGCDMDGAFAGDWNGNGRDEIWALAGPWAEGGMSLMRLEYDPPTKRLKPFVVPFASFYHMDQSYRPGENEIMMGAGWWEGAFIEGLVRLGPEAFGRGRKPAGAYVLKIGPETIEATMLDRLTWEQVRGRHFCHPKAVRLRCGGRDFVWTWVQHWAKVGREEPYKIRIFHRLRDSWAFLAELQTFEKSYTDAQSWDVDGDGDDELVVGSTIYGLGGISEEPDAGDEPSSESRLPPPSHASLTLRRAREAYGFGIINEALALYREVLDKPGSLEDLDEAASGRIRCLLGKNRIKDAAEEAMSMVRDYSRLLAKVGPMVVDALAARGQWALAAPLARRMLAEQRLSHEKGKRLREIVHRAEELEGMSPVLTLKTILSGTEVSLLASTPVLGAPGEDGSLNLYVQGVKDGDFLLVPIERAKGVLRIRSAWNVVRHEWNNSWEFGFLSGTAWGYGSGKPENWVLGGLGEAGETVRLSLEGLSSGNTAFPTLFLRLHSGKAHEILSTTIAQGRDQSAVLTFSPKGRQLHCDFEHPKINATSHCLFDASLDGKGRSFLYIRGRALRSAGRSQSLFRFDTFTLEGDPNAVRPVRFVPIHAAEHLFLANGEFLRGRLDEAASLYDKVVVLADDEAAKAKDLEASKFFPPIDARFFRALLRVRRGGDREGALADLLAARKLSEKRVMTLIDRCAFPLKDQEAFRDLLADYFKAVHKAQKEGAPPFLDWLKRFASLGTLGLVLPSMGYRLARNIDVLGTEAAYERKPVEGPFVKGDIILTYNGIDIEDPYAFQRFQDKARRVGKPVKVEILRNGSCITLSHDPSKHWIAAKLRLAVERVD